MSGGVALAAGLACALFGWTPEDAWAATPRDLAHGLAARALLGRGGRPLPAARAELEAMKARLT